MTYPASADELTARAIMLADREPPPDNFSSKLRQMAHPATAVAALRRSPERRSQLWGAMTYQCWLLSAADEQELMSNATPTSLTMDDKACAALVQQLRTLEPAKTVAASLGSGTDLAIQTDYAESPALVVRDPLLRPLLRALLRDDLPDRPVLAIGDLTTQAVSRSRLSSGDREHQ